LIHSVLFGTFFDICPEPVLLNDRFQTEKKKTAAAAAAAAEKKSAIPPT
jgi:hypothetical protein